MLSHLLATQLSHLPSFTRGLKHAQPSQDFNRARGYCCRLLCKNADSGCLIWAQLSSQLVIPAHGSWHHEPANCSGDTMQTWSHSSHHFPLHKHRSQNMRDDWTRGAGGRLQQIESWRTPTNCLLSSSFLEINSQIRAKKFTNNPPKQTEIAGFQIPSSG